MTKTEFTPALAVAKDLFSQDSDGLRQLIQTVVQEVRTHPARAAGDQAAKA